MRLIPALGLFLLLLSQPQSLLAAPGGLDYSFDSDGYVTTAFGASLFDRAFAVALQADGKIVAAGVTGICCSYDFAIARYNTDGSLDTTFDGDGLVTTDFGGADNAWAVAVQTDGKIVAAGDSSDVTQRFALARYNSDGSLDTTFDGDGKVTTGFDDLASAAAMVIQTDGKIVLGGLATGTTGVEFALARYNADGSLDSNFDTDGKVTTAFTGEGIAWTMALATDDKIVLAGQTLSGPTDADFALARYNTDGSLDTTFDTDGKVTTDFNSGPNVVNKVLIQTDGKIVAVGDSSAQGDTGIGSSTDFTLARYNTNGTLDTTFDTDGKVTTDFNGLGDAAYGAALQSDGKIIAVGVAVVSTEPLHYNFAAARYNTDGSLDPNFDTDGKVTTAISGYDSVALAIVIQTDGQIVIAGILNDGTKYYFGVVRVNYSALENNSQTISAGGTVTTDTESDGANLLDPVETTITSPNGGTITISENTATTPTPTGFSALGQQVTITAPEATAANPLVIVFRFDVSAVAGANKDLIEVYKNGGVQVASCTGPAGQASPDPCIASIVLEADGDVTITVLSSTASNWNFAVKNSDLPLVTGGGWIKPEAGKASFGFKVRSEMDPPKLSGQINFVADNLHFKSDSVDLLTTGDTRAKYSGVGNVNGSSGYSYVVIIEDGKLSASDDRFRIKITDAGGVVVYDNVPGSSDDIELATPQEIGGGSIVIH